MAVAAKSLPICTDKTPAYDDVVARYGLTLLEGGGDLQVENGDIAVTKDGDLKLGDAEHNALFRLVQRWRYTAPTLEHMFEMVYAAKAKEEKLNECLDRVHSVDRPNSQAAHPLFDDGAIRRYREIAEEIAATELSYEVCAGSVVLVLCNLLLRFKDDIAATDDDWKDTAPLFGGYSVGSVLVASANNFRHNDEWARTCPPTKQQLGSISVLAAALGEPLAADGKRHRLSRNVSHEILSRISNGNFEQLNSQIFDFVNTLAIRRRSCVAGTP